MNVSDDARALIVDAAKRKRDQAPPGYAPSVNELLLAELIVQVKRLADEVESLGAEKRR